MVSRESLAHMPDQALSNGTSSMKAKVVIELMKGNIYIYIYIMRASRGEPATHRPLVGVVQPVLANSAIGARKDILARGCPQ